MRLQCPNCDAIYEVGDGVIPPEGREVQCSNCDHTWYQHPEEPDQRHESDPDTLVPQAATTTDKGLEDDDFEAALQAALAVEEDTDADQEQTVDRVTSKEATTPATHSATERPSLDPGVTEVLREEAAREIAQRRHESPPPEIETQPDLGLEEADTTAAAVKAHSQTEPEYNSPGTRQAAPPSRRDLLPDIEEINSSLRSTAERPRSARAPTSDTVEETRSRRSGFRMGFALILLVAALGVIAYAFAPQIVEQAPQAEPYLTQYIKLVNGWRLDLDAMVQRLTAYVQSLTG